jgi:hypothetical protein
MEGEPEAAPPSAREAELLRWEGGDTVGSGEVVRETAGLEKEDPASEEGAEGAADGATDTAADGATVTVPAAACSSLLLSASRCADMLLAPRLTRLRKLARSELVWSTTLSEGTGSSSTRLLLLLAPTLVLL